MIYTILILLAGLNIAPFLFNKLAIWTAQGLFAHLMIALIFFVSFFEKPKNEEPNNIYLALFYGWVCITSGIIIYNTMLGNKYDIQHFFSYFNLFMALLLYKYIIQYMDVSLFKLGKTVLKYAILFNLFLAVLQQFNCSQFFQLIFPNSNSVNNKVTGIIGNGTHLSGFVAMCSPLFFTNKRQDNLTLVLMVLVMCFSGTTLNDPAISGFIVLISCALYYSFYMKKKLFFSTIGIMAILVSLTLIFLPREYLLRFISTSGRTGLWEYYWVICKQTFITGIGLGTMQSLAMQSEYKTAFHMHLEYYQVLLELGIIGLCLLIGIILDFLKTEVDEEFLVYKTIVVGFMVSCCFTYPAHLWLPAMYALYAYSLVKGNRECLLQRKAKFVLPY